MLQCYTHHNEPVLRPLSHVVAALGPSQLALGLGPAGLAVVCHLVTISGAASPPPGHKSRVTCHNEEFVTGVIPVISPDNISIFVQREPLL